MDVRQVSNGIHALRKMLAHDHSRKKPEGDTNHNKKTVKHNKPRKQASTTIKHED
jgi:hypothetical protein